MNASRPSLLNSAMLAALLSLTFSAAAFAQGITLDLGKTVTGRYMTLVGNTPGSDGEITSLVYIAPEYAARNKGTSMYFDIDDSTFYKLSAGWHVIVNVEYYDAPGVQIKLVYDAAGDHAGKEHAQTITTAGTNTWKSKSFTINDAYFGNGLAHSADFKLVAVAGTMTINAVSVAPYEAFYDYGSVNDSLSLQWTVYQGGDSKTQIVTQAGEECVSTIGASQYLYLSVDDSFLFSGKPTGNVFVTVEYFDSDPTLSMRLQYDAVNTAMVNSYKATPYIYGKGFGSYRIFTFELSDAYFANRENGPSDFRIQIAKAGLAINRIMIARLPEKPIPVPNLFFNATAYKALEAPTLDGMLGEWSWLAPSPIIPLYAKDGSRIDEFYRTWFLNHANVPVAEPGEPGVTDPGVAGLWDVKDLTGSVRVMWDDQNLYLAASIRDNVVSTSGATWENKDGFGFYIDCSHDYNAAGTAPVPRKDDQRFTQGEHFFFFPAEQGQAGTWCHSTSQEGETMPGSVTKTVLRTDSGYTIEASVPLSVIADGLAWHPGIAGDKDAFDPLFAWMVNDNDGLSASGGRVMSGGHNADDEFWGTLAMSPIPLVDHGIMIDFGATNYEHDLRPRGLQDDAGAAMAIVERAGKTGLRLSSAYLYLDIEDTIWNAAKHPHALLSIEYFDSSATGSRFRLQYDGDTDAYAEVPSIVIGTTGTWKTAIIELKDARFESRQNNHADFRIQALSGATDVIINQVRVAMADLWIDLGDTTTSFGIFETSRWGDGARLPATVGGIDCKRNAIEAFSPARYFYHGVADSLIYHGDHPKLFMTVEYYDTTSSGGLGMVYDGGSAIFTPAIGDAFILGERQWKLHTFYLPDAFFTNRMSSGDDFRINSKGDGPSFINRILIGSLNGITTAVEGKPAAEPVTFRLAQNYPNPFNPSTMISFILPSRAFVSLKVYDIMGREVSTILSESLPAGNYARQWNAAGMPSGVYFYQLMAGPYSATRKLMLLK